MADVNRGSRPLSPHIQIYRPQLTSVSSIMVRITGIGLLFVAALIVAWLIAAATSEPAFTFVDGVLRSWFGDIVLLAAVWAFVYHMLGRLRHVLWDFGYCFEVPVAERLAIGMFGVSTVVTVLVALARFGGLL
ncbi:MAG: succinate dehydrogenase, cytochrome b556 subunit [Pseudomonadota bacterium]